MRKKNRMAKQFRMKVDRQRRNKNGFIFVKNRQSTHQEAC